MRPAYELSRGPKSRDRPESVEGILEVRDSSQVTRPVSPVLLQMMLCPGDGADSKVFLLVD